MRCHICDKALAEPRYNQDHESYEPCDACLAVINDTLDGYRDKPSATEDELGIDPVFEGLYPTVYTPQQGEE